MTDDKEDNKGGQVRDVELPQEYRDARGTFYYRGSELDLAVYQNRDDRDPNLEEYLKAAHYLTKTTQTIKGICPEDQENQRNIEAYLKDYMRVYNRDPNQGLPKLIEAHRVLSHILEKYTLNFEYTRKLCL